jgi:translation initiation factor 6 (eIF-6)
MVLDSLQQTVGKAGWLARLGALVMPGRMSKWHQRWLEELKEVAEKEVPIF